MRFVLCRVLAHVRTRCTSTRQTTPVVAELARRPSKIGSTQLRARRSKNVFEMRRSCVVCQTTQPSLDAAHVPAAKFGLQRHCHLLPCATENQELGKL